MKIYWNLNCASDILHIFIYLFINVRQSLLTWFCYGVFFSKYRNYWALYVVLTIVKPLCLNQINISDFNYERSAAMYNGE